LCEQVTDFSRHFSVYL